MASVLVVGSSRGIGLGLVDVHLEAGWQVHATTRDGSAPRSNPAVTPHRLDVRDERQLETVIAELGAPVDRFIHNAGVMRAPRAELMEVNAEAPIRTVESLLAAERFSQGATIALITSQSGARRGSSGSLGDYGDSKAALNDEFRKRCPAWAAAGVVATVIHPGWVRTDMGGSAAPLSIGESALGIKEVLDGLGPDDHGRFLNWDGRPHPW